MLLSTAERWVFTYGLQVTSWLYADGIVSTNNSADYALFVCFVRPVRPRFRRLRKVRRQSRPCIYYANTASTFQPFLEGDLGFKLDPGPDKSYQIPSRSADGGGCRQGTKRSSRNSENLIRIHCSNGVPLVNGNRNQSLLLCSLNTCSVRNKTADVFDYACDCKADLFTFTESWLREGADAVRAELSPDCYKFMGQNRIGRSGGGTGITYCHSLNVKRIDGGEHESFEFSEWMVSGRSTKKLRVVIIYRPPYSENHSLTVLTFCSEFANYMESILLSKEQLLIVGDMHHVDDAREAGARNFLDLLESLGLKQHVRGPTHIHGHTLDLVVTRLAENIILDTPKADRYLSDHAAILRKLTSSKPLNTVKEVMYHRTKSVDISALSCDLGESSLCRDVLSNSHPDILSACDLDSLNRIE